MQFTSRLRVADTKKKTNANIDILQANFKYPTSLKIELISFRSDKSKRLEEMAAIESSDLELSQIDIDGFFKKYTTETILSKYVFSEASNVSLIINFFIWLSFLRACLTH